MLVLCAASANPHRLGKFLPTNNSKLSQTMMFDDEFYFRCKLILDGRARATKARSKQQQRFRLTRGGGAHPPHHSTPNRLVLATVGARSARHRVVAVGIRKSSSPTRLVYRDHLSCRNHHTNRSIYEFAAVVDPRRSSVTTAVDFSTKQLMGRGKWQGLDREQESSRQSTGRWVLRKPHKNTHSRYHMPLRQ
jgi:hypothetical protein